MADGSIVIETDLETAKLKNKLEKLNNDIERQTGKVKSLQAEYDKLLSGEGTPAVNPEFEKLTKQIEKAEAALNEYNQEFHEISEGAKLDLSRSTTAEQRENVKQLKQMQLEKLDQKYAKQIAMADWLNEKLSETPETLESSSERAEKLRSELESAKTELEKMQLNAAGVKKEIADALTPSNGIQQHLEAAQKSLGTFEKRLKTIAKKVFVFSLLTAALRSVKGYMSEALAANESFQASLASLRGTLRTAFQPVLSFAIPALQALINVFNTAMNYIARLTSWIFGTTVNASREAAAALYDQTKATAAAGAAAEKAKRQMSGLDEMNTWQSSSASGGGGGGSAVDVDFSVGDEIKSEANALEVYISGALLALGAILAFTGVSIPLGIALMLMGAARLASALSLDWDKMPDEIKSALTKTMAVLGVASLVIGAILAFSGVNLPLGIALMLIGAGALGTAIALNWDTLKSKLTGEMAKYYALLGVASLVIGAILAFSGVNLPLGIALILAGAAGLVTVTSLNWNALLDKFKEVWEKIKSWWNRSVAPKFTLKFWKQKFSSIAEGLTSKIKDGINAAIALFNRFVNWINDKMNIKWSAVKIAGAEVIPKGNFQLLKLNNIPHLARGAVIPANREFMAVLGDQKNGRNLEAPENLIRQIVREESGRGGGYYEFVAKIQGKTLFDEVIEQAKIKKRITGKNPFELGGA